MKNKLLNIFKNLFFLGLGLLILWLVTKDQPFDKIYAELKKTNYFWIVLSIVPGVLSHLFRALRWNLMIESLSYKTKTSTTFHAVWIGYLANLAVPRIGEITRCGVLSKKGKIPMNSLIGTVVLERTIDMIVLLLIILGAILFQLDLLGGYVGKHIQEPLLNKLGGGAQILVIIGIIALFILGGYYAIKLTIKKLNQYTFFYKIKRFYIGFIRGIKSIAKLKSKWLFLFHTFIIWFMYVSMVFLPFYAMSEMSEGPNALNFIDAITIMAIGSLGIVAPVPGGIGTYHAIVIGILTGIYGISESVSTTFAYLVHATQTGMIIIVGLFSYAILFLFKNKPKQT